MELTVPIAECIHHISPALRQDDFRLTDEKVFGQFLRDLEAYSGAGVIKDALLFQILTMTRPDEVRGAKQQEFDLEKATWTVPAERVKMRRDHVVPLSEGEECGEGKKSL